MVRSEAEVERLVRENQKLVQYEVNRYLQRYFVGTMEREDLISWGLIGLVQAARAWDPERADRVFCPVPEGGFNERRHARPVPHTRRFAPGREYNHRRSGTAADDYRRSLRGR